MASIMEGPLSKWTNVMKGWQYRWFVLDYNAGLLSYYTYCLNFSCQEVRFQMDTTLCRNDVHCNSNGVCNNLNHCHCSIGFVPPNCEPLPGGFGSTDDGHQYKDGETFLKERSLGHPKHRLQLVFYISIPVFIIAAALIIKQDKIRELCYKEELESESSVSEESSTNSKPFPSASNSH